MLETAEYPQRLSVLLGLVPWRLRRDVANEAPMQSVPRRAAEQVQVAAAAEKPLPVMRVSAADTASGTYVQPVSLAQGVRVWAADTLTLASIPDCGSWWLPALSAGEEGMRLFRSAAEAEMLYTVLSAASLDDVAMALQQVDAHFAAGDFLPNRLPPDPQELLSLPKPWLLCGAIADRQGRALAGESVPFLLHHPLLLLTNPQYKRSAWQQILAYRQVIHA